MYVGRMFYKVKLHIWSYPTCTSSPQPANCTHCGLERSIVENRLFPSLLYDRLPKFPISSTSTINTFVKSPNSNHIWRPCQLPQAVLMSWGEGLHFPDIHKGPHVMIHTGSQITLNSLRLLVTKSSAMAIFGFFPLYGHNNKSTWPHR